MNHLCYPTIKRYALLSKPVPEEEKYSVKSEEPFLIKFTTRKNFFQEMNSLRRTVLFKPPELDKDVV